MHLWKIISLKEFFLLISCCPVCFGIHQEACLLDNFSASCGAGLLTFSTAKYGRMDRGKCITDTNPIGCQANVIQNVDSRCSGKQTCTFKVADLSDDGVNPCPANSFMYLSASPLCLEGKALDPLVAVN